MSCPNYTKMNYGMPMVCGGMEVENENDYYWEFEDAEYLAKEFSKNLQYHKVTIECGHYYGFQFFVDETYSYLFDLDRNSRYCIDNEDAHSYFGMCRSKVIRKADAEKRKIAKWLEKIADEYRYEILVRVALFSNGEAVYDRRSPRSVLKAAVA